MNMLFLFLFKQKTAYEMRIGDCSSSVCSSDLAMVERLPMGIVVGFLDRPLEGRLEALRLHLDDVSVIGRVAALHGVGGHGVSPLSERSRGRPRRRAASSSSRVAVTIEPTARAARSEEHTSELQSLMRIS